MKKLCRTKGINIYNLEKSVGIGNGTIAGWKKFFPKITSLKKVADYFGVSIEELLKNSEKDAG